MLVERIEILIILFLHSRVVKLLLVETLLIVVITSTVDGIL